MALETPISAIFRGPDTVWKMRKAVCLTFLDFTTLAERERTARRELALNAPTAPGLYRDVVPVTRSDDALEVDGPGEVVDWVVRMARVPEEDFLDNIISRDALSPPLLDAIADTVAALHDRLSSTDADPLAAIRRSIEGNHASALAAGLPPALVDAWQDNILTAVSAKAAWLAGRSGGGFVRRAHGDLHLGNLCLWQGAPVAFDAMEFDEAMATIDLGYDLAFLLMDLELRAGRASANRVLNRYVARTGDAALVVGLPVFLSLRAMVRAHVCCHGGGEWRAYLDFALTCLHPSPPLAVGLGGLPGVGKSTLARALAPQLGCAPGALVLRSDEIRKRLFKVLPERRLPREAYAEAVNRAVMSEVFAAVAIVTGAGHSVIADLSFMSMSDRMAMAEASGSEIFSGVWLHAPLAVLEARVAARHGDASDADLDVLRRAISVDPGPGDWWQLDTTEPDALCILMGHVTKSGPMC